MNDATGVNEMFAARVRRDPSRYNMGEPLRSEPNMGYGWSRSDSSESSEREM